MGDAMNEWEVGVNRKAEEVEEKEEKEERVEKKRKQKDDRELRETNKVCVCSVFICDGKPMVLYGHVSLLLMVRNSLLPS